MRINQTHFRVVPFNARITTATGGKLVEVTGVWLRGTCILWVDGNCQLAGNIGKHSHDSPGASTVVHNGHLHQKKNIPKTKLHWKT